MTPHAELIGPGSEVDDRRSAAGVRGYFVTRASTIGAGTAEMERTTVADEVLGLPHDPGMPSAATRKPPGSAE